MLTALLGILAVVAPLVGVWVGARLGDRSSEDAWLREQRLNAYLALLDQLEALINIFAVGQRVSRFREDAAAHGHDFEGVDEAWSDAMTDLRHLEMRISILGGRVGEVYNMHAHALLSDMLEALDDESVPEPEWDKLVSRGHVIQEALEASAREDMQVGALKKSKQPRWMRKIGVG